MRRFLILLLLLLPAAEAMAQYDPYKPANTQQDPRVRRALREKAVAYAGVSSRDFVEKFGDDAVAAIFACSQGGAAKLLEFYNSGDLEKLPRPADFLKVVALPPNGDDVVLWAMQHAKELSDVDNFDAYLHSPLEYTCALKPLEQGAAEARARRLAMQAAVTPAQQQMTVDVRTLAWVAGAAVIVGLLIWWRRSRQVT